MREYLCPLPGISYLRPTSYHVGANNAGWGESSENATDDIR